VELVVVNSVVVAVRVVMMIAALGTLMMGEATALHSLQTVSLFLCCYF
jgi:hypothetical protein